MLSICLGQPCWSTDELSKIKQMTTNVLDKEGRVTFTGAYSHPVPRNSKLRWLPTPCCTMVQFICHNFRCSHFIHFSFTGYEPVDTRVTFSCSLHRAGCLLGSHWKWIPYHACHLEILWPTAEEYHQSWVHCLSKILGTWNRVKRRNRNVWYKPVCQTWDWPDDHRLHVASVSSYLAVITPKQLYTTLFKNSLVLDEYVGVQLRHMTRGWDDCHSVDHQWSYELLFNELL